MRGNDSGSILREALRQLQQAPPGETWTQQQWCEAFSFLFLAAPGSRHALLEHQDDMLWFVTATNVLGPGTPPVTLRRNTSSELAPELRLGGSAFTSVDWALSLQLNLVVQAKYILTVVQCRQETLAAVAQGHATSGHYNPSNQQRDQLNTVVAQRRVYASPMAADVNLEEAKSGQPLKACYPDVCFAVDNFEDAFQDVILSRSDDCYCVMLHVHSSTDGSTEIPQLSTVPTEEGANSVNQSATTFSTPAAAQLPLDICPVERRAVLFSAYVTREQIAGYLASRVAETPKPSILNRLLARQRPEDVKPRREKVVMIGPGSVGRAEVLAAATSANAGDATGRVTPLQLSLMWISLPAGALAQAVLRFACTGNL
ncbi:hypothetical protein VOLCADRAFT_117831 [Volvox carteri f. nagariensis]|uniref:Uncharacterized protein n=1 Tax=Volvox carteri f. nagariensis TaxID=3068 RepID=D8TY58_VOLCA|nr:uncharacterized protein VOLCADRAFT_117831 [Volvox carteri f. nagariensis]EFJ47588.1 hypothetical protein VOLCADRAFT_117831 [Volvox carteri f. nagariensis]|eukprot:XP_002951412.1 hypothetical protein VOLCADRAFT_117831 [Volvox carteri f. nagariensis]